MNKTFLKDYYRMTGKKYTFIEGYIQLIFGHRLRYMKYFRKIQENPNVLLRMFYEYKLFRLKSKYGIEINSSTKIGYGFAMFHPYNITVNPQTIIGNNCNICKGLTIGVENRGKRVGAPIIGDRVFIGINSTIVGHVHIGNNVMIAPNSFVNCDVPDNSIVIGNPCQIIPSLNATVGYINFIVEGDQS